MNGIIILNFFLSLGGILAILFVYFLIKKELEIRFKEKEVKEAQEGISALEKLSVLFQELRKELETRLETTQKEIQDKLEKSVERTAKIEEVARVLENYSGDLRNLKEVLAGTKTRGALGEKTLEEILKELPNSVYERQFRIGLNIVDFVLKINDTIIPIDSKFPYSSYVKNFERRQRKRKRKTKKRINSSIN
jgi:DNA anti-recombination protein RmuC